MILTTYPQFRQHFAAPGALTALDGFPAWPGPDVSDGTISSTPSNLRLNGFDGTIRAVTNSGLGFVFQLPVGGVGPLIDYTKTPIGDPFWPLRITCNLFADDAVIGVHDYIWYVSMRRDPGFYPYIGSSVPVEFTAAEQIFSIVMPNPTAKSGLIDIHLNTSSAAELLQYLTGTDRTSDYALSYLLRNVHLYVKRVSDGAIQYCAIYRRITSG